MVRAVGIEPTLLSEPDFESGASTSSTTPAASGQFLVLGQPVRAPEDAGRASGRRNAADYSYAGAGGKWVCHSFCRAGVSCRQDAGLQVPNEVMTASCETVVSVAPGSERDICITQPTSPSEPCSVMLSPELDADSIGDM